MNKVFSSLAGAMFCVLFASNTLAGPIITSFTGGNGLFDVFYSGSVGDAVGFQFVADRNLSVTDLGILVDSFNGVVDSTHQVGLWRASDQSLLGSTSVDGTGTVVGDFIYSSLASAISLNAGQSYVLAAVYAAGDGDTYLSGPISIVTDGISMTEAVFPAAGDIGFSFPTLFSTGNLGRLGPNAIAVDVPSPATLALMGLGLAGLGWKRRKA